jgi:hypothetical protein
VDVDPYVEVLFVVGVGDDRDFVVAGVAFLVVDEGVQVVVLQKLLGTALPRDVVVIPVRVVDEGDVHLLVRLVLLRLVEVELEGGGVRDHLANLVEVLEGRQQLQSPRVGAVEVGDQVAVRREQ